MTTPEQPQYAQPQQQPAAYYPPAGPYGAAAPRPAAVQPVGGVWTWIVLGLGALLALVAFILLIAGDYGKPPALGGALMGPGLIMIGLAGMGEAIGGAIKKKTCH